VREADALRRRSFTIAFASAAFAVTGLGVAIALLARAASAEGVERVPLAAITPLAALSRAHIQLPNPPPACPDEMANIGGLFCVDRWEASTEVIDEHGQRVADHSPFRMVRDGRVRAVSRPGVHPQAHISRNEADVACKNAGKRLCSDEEWVNACRGAKNQAFPYGSQHRPGLCNDNARSPLIKLYGKAPPPHKLGYYELNHPGLNQQGGLALAGTFAACENESGIFDMVGNLHEWTSNTGGVFRGGYYRDTTQHGDGCSYVTTVHGPGYRDYSTGFRCCADLAL
jgi:formylglycine-generating enzyme required for sulfatase activity